MFIEGVMLYGSFATAFKCFSFSFHTEFFYCCMEKLKWFWNHCGKQEENAFVGLLTVALYNFLLHWKFLLGTFRMENNGKEFSSCWSWRGKDWGQTNGIRQERNLFVGTSRSSFVCRLHHKMHFCSLHLPHTLMLIRGSFEFSLFPSFIKK